MIPIYLIKKHLNIDDSFTEDDDYLIELERVALALVEKHIDKPIKDLLDEGGELPTPLSQAVLLQIGNMYQSRESVAFSKAVELPKSYDYILDMYKDYSKKEKDGGIFK